MENELCCRCKKNTSSMVLPVIGGYFFAHEKPVFSVDRICEECYKKQIEGQKKTNDK